MLKKNKVRTAKARACHYTAGFLTYLFIILAAVLFTASFYKTHQFGDAQIEEILFYFFNGFSEGGAASVTDMIQSNAIRLLIILFFLLLPVIDFCRNRVVIHGDFRLRGRKKPFIFNPSKIPRRIKLLYAFIVLILSVWYTLSSFHVADYVRSISQSSQLFETRYVDPKTATLTFPEKKRNLVYIYMESMENTLASKEHGGKMEPSRIPELESIALDPKNVSFSNQPSGQLGGALPVTGTTWTVAAMSAQSMGVPLRQSLFGAGANDQGAFNRFLPGAYGLGEILEEQGYNQSFMMGSDVAFGGRDKLLSQHGNYTVVDYTQAKKQKAIAEDYKVWWGYEDKKLFDFAQKEVTRLSKEDKPFNLQLLTADTHFSDGYLDSTCQTTYQRKYDNVHACSSKKVADFVAWVRQQPFADNTTIILTGDHLGMQTAYYDELIGDDSLYQRTVYNAFINSAIRPEKQNGRLLSSFDMYPSTLAALGVEIKGDRLGLGSNLFSSTPTLLEDYGTLNALNQELSKRSVFYDQKIVSGL